MPEPPRTRFVMPKAPRRPFDRRKEIRRLVASALLMGTMGTIALLYTHPWTARPGMRVAIARFDNETGKKEYGRFADALTDSVAEDLSAAAAGRYRVIASGALLRAPRERRDLAAIGASLGASYVVVGRVQPSPLGIRVTADLIHLPDQAHIRVVSLDRKVGDTKKARVEIAISIADEFAPRLNLITSVPQ